MTYKTRALILNLNDLCRPNKTSSLHIPLVRDSPSSAVPIGLLGEERRTRSGEKKRGRGRGKHTLFHSFLLRLPDQLVSNMRKAALACIIFPAMCGGSPTVVVD